jgi:hypothetical protein
MAFSFFNSSTQTKRLFVFCGCDLTSTDPYTASRTGLQDYNMTYVTADPYNWPYNGDLTPQNTALIIIDMQVNISTADPATLVMSCIFACHSKSAWFTARAPKHKGNYEVLLLTAACKHSCKARGELASLESLPGTRGRPPTSGEAGSSGVDIFLRALRLELVSI